MRACTAIVRRGATAEALDQSRPIAEVTTSSIVKPDRSMSATSFGSGWRLTDYCGRLKGCRPRRVGSAV